MTLRLFEGVGIELEYMIARADTLDVLPAADRLLEAVGGGYECEVERGDVAWSNELALHVIEMKTNGPAPRLEGLAAKFQSNVQEMLGLLAPMGATLLGTGMHPWMDPVAELRLWPHENDVIYKTFDRIFDCRGHGWANLQSMHINLPFGDADEFTRLHEAIRLVLPLLPALAASTPVVEGSFTGSLDRRLEVYATNAARVPSVSGAVVPESVASPEEYQQTILQRIYHDLAPLDPDGILRHEWANARGAIARFDRDAIEIRVLDVQEAPRADLAIASLVVAAVRHFTAREPIAGLPLDHRRLAEIFWRAARDGEAALLEDPEYLRRVGFDGPVTAGEAWRQLRALASSDADVRAHAAELDILLTQGPLARRIATHLGARGPGSVARPRLLETYRRLEACMARGEMFVP